MRNETKQVIYDLYMSYYRYCYYSFEDTSIDIINESWYKKIDYLVSTYKERGWKSPKQMIDFYIKMYNDLAEYHQKFPTAVVAEENRRPGERYLP